MKEKTGFEQTYWQGYVDLYAEAFRRGLEVEGGGFTLPEATAALTENVGAHAFPAQIDARQKSVILCSPHPDDECLVGALPLRLLREKRTRVVNLAVTLGSNVTRRAQRRKELEEACGILGFENIIVGEDSGLDNVNGLFREAFPYHWGRNVELLVELFYRIRPGLVFMPHGEDGHLTHEGTHLLVSDALSVYTRGLKAEILAVETEFWRQNRDPNLLVGVSSEDVALLVSALTRHRGEVSRNPYHLWMPARFMDNVRRGWELVRGSLEKTPDFCFAELYRVSSYCRGDKKEWCGDNLVFSPDQKLDFF